MLGSTFFLPEINQSNLRCLVALVRLSRLFINSSIFFGKLQAAGEKGKSLFNSEFGMSSNTLFKCTARPVSCGVRKRFNIFPSLLLVDSPTLNKTLC